MRGAHVWEEWVNKEFTHTMRVRAAPRHPPTPPPRLPGPLRACRGDEGWRLPVACVGEGLRPGQEDGSGGRVDWGGRGQGLARHPLPPTSPPALSWSLPLSPSACARSCSLGLVQVSDLLLAAQAKGRWERPTSTASEAKSREFHSTNDRIFPHKAGPMAFEQLSGTQVAKKSSERAERRAIRRAERKERHNVIRKKLEGLCGQIEQERAQRSELEKELEALQQGKPYKKPQPATEPEEEGWFNKPAAR